MSTLAAEVQKATEACAPLLEKDGEQFHVANNLQTLGAALQARMKEKELDVDALWKAIGKKRISEKDFVKYLTDLPTDINHDELSAFSDERRAALFKLISSSDKGVAKEDFKNIFRQFY